jgi:ATP-dependent exoDNAse (exonuclease V) beta subunit
MAVGGPLPVSLAEVRRRAAADAATAIAAVVGGGWTVHDPNDDRRRAARYADVAVLIPARSALPALEDALEESGVPYRLEGAALLWGAEEVRDVLCVLRAVDDPADTVAVLGALRSPGLACGDDDLVTWHGAGGTWDLRAPAPDGLGSHPVAEAMAVLRRLHGRRWWCEPSALVAAAYQELRSFELALSHRRPRDYWHRLRWLQDQARLFDESPGGTMRDFLVWAELRAKGDGRAGGVGPPDPDDDAVRVMTIHGSKGLEFPVTVVAGLERDQADGPPPPAVVWTEHGIPEIHVGRFRSAGFEQAGLRDQRLDVLEQHRLLYVAMTRARDHLILCLHHKERGAHPDSSLAALVTRLCAENPTLWETIPTTNGTNHGNGHRNGNGNGNGHQNGNGQTEGPGQDSPACDLLPSDWESERRLLLDRLRRRPVTSATAVAERAMLENSAARDRAGAPGPPDDAPGQPDDAPLLIGRAVHSALADLDLSTSCDAAGRSADEVARAAAQGVGVGAHASAVAAMVQRALTSATVRRAAIGRHWREVPVAMPVGHGGVLEGFVDLLFQDGDGLVVVDYKTDRIANGHNLGTSVATYRIQLAAYAAALESSTGLPVSRCVLVFLGPDAGAGAVGATGEPWEHVIAGHDLSAAKAEALRVADELSAFGRTR